VNKNSNNRNKQREVIVITQGDKRQAKIAFFISNECKNRVSITRIWNRVTNFGTGSGYPIPATNH